MPLRGAAAAMQVWRSPYAPIPLQCRWMPRALVTCSWKKRGCGSRLAVDLTSGTGLPSRDLCPKCGEPGALRHILVQARTRWPNRVWTVQDVQVLPSAANAASEAEPVSPSARPKGRGARPAKPATALAPTQQP